MTNYFVRFVICTQDGRLNGMTYIVSAPEGANQAEILKILQDGDFPEAEYIMKFERWEG